MRVLLVDPPGTNKGLNTGLAYLSANLSDSHDVNVLDLNNVEIGLCGDPNPEMSLDEVEKRITEAVDEFKPELFGVSVKTYTAEISRHIFQLINNRKRGIVTIAGGPHITLDGLQFIQENDIDYGLQGEGEYTLPALCNALERKGAQEKIGGLIYWKNGRIHCNPMNSTIADLDSLPYPRYDDFSSVMDNGRNVNEYPLLTSRGCPYQCSYCSMPRIMGGKWRCHSSERVIMELEHAKLKYKNTSFTVVDDNFTLNLKRVEDICEQLIFKKMNLPWNSQNGIRADRISAHLARKMRHSGCHYVWIGIESADDKVFKATNKGEKIEDITRGIKHLKDAGIRVGGFFITGLPYSTRESDLKSVDFVKEHGIDGWWFHFVPYPHTKAWNWVHAHGKILRSSNGALQFGANDIEPVFETEEYSKKNRMRAYDEIHIKMRHFDRLGDPSLNQWKRWQRVYRKVRPYELRTIISFLVFIIAYNARLAKKRIVG